MYKILREIKYSNGKISVTNRFDGIEVKVIRDDEIVEIKSFPFSICDNKEMLDNILGSLKKSHALLFIEDDCTSILSYTNKRFVIRGSEAAIYILYSNDGSLYMKQAFLPYKYEDLSLNDYINLFGYC